MKCRRPSPPSPPSPSSLVFLGCGMLICCPEDERISVVPRLRYDDLEPELRALLAEKYERLGYLGEFFQVTAHQPAALADFIRFTNAVGAALPVALGEIAALVVSAALGNDYERHQ